MPQTSHFLIGIASVVFGVFVFWYGIVEQFPVTAPYQILVGVFFLYVSVGIFTLGLFQVYKTLKKE